jgi:hypothetical protein
MTWHTIRTYAGSSLRWGSGVVVSSRRSDVGWSYLCVLGSRSLIRSVFNDRSSIIQQLGWTVVLVTISPACLRLSACLV